MKNQQFQITLSQEVMKSLREAAEKKGITPNLLVRILLYERFNQSETKAYVLTTDDWSKIEGYVEEKGLPSVECFAIQAMNYLIKKNALTTNQKRRLEEKYKKVKPIDSRGIA
jgi:hypothetical protein